MQRQTDRHAIIIDNLEAGHDDQATKGQGAHHYWDIVEPLNASCCTLFVKEVHVFVANPDHNEACMDIKN